MNYHQLTVKQVYTFQNE